MIMSTSQKILGTSVRWAMCRSRPGNYSSNPSLTSLSITRKSRDDEDEWTATHRSRAHTSEIRHYHTTRRAEFLYPAIIVVAALGYVGYKTYMREPLTPKDAISGKTEYERMEKDRLERNQRKRSAFGKPGQEQKKNNSDQGPQ
eukprot:CAMPEP_0113588918 /NCGR_PEP_ID=MMETSP0015_2-20120614/35795_1 /TAXON_ID=2838 /ORGANISM="Odontella" /LENGTH=143 /DNA_ID=CAMNT_0000494871 /DNA_START=30 /DNA_END=461 /DNA_ORIENTATION=- /assembly_acc=CAM_ASM_000160